MTKTAVSLIPAEGAERVGDDLYSRSEQPWLRIANAETLFRGQWIRIRYRSSFFDDPVRPLLRFERASDGPTYHALNGPVLGAATAIVHVPDDAVSVSISPIARAGRFDFIIDEIERISRVSLLARGLLRGPSWTLVSAGATLIGARREAVQALYFAIGSTSLAGYDAWYRRLARGLDLNGLDRPRSDWRIAPQIRFIMDLDANNRDRMEATLKSLQAQAYPRWTLHALVSPKTGPDLLAAYRLEMGVDPRLAEFTVSTRIEDSQFSPDDRIAVIESGDTVPNYALAVVAETIIRTPESVIVYGDEDAAAANGSLHSPIFKPDWSPTFQAAARYIGRLTCVRCLDIVQAGWVRLEQLVADEPEMLNAVTNLTGMHKVAHVRRILYRRRHERLGTEEPPQIKVSAATPTIAAPRGNWPAVTIIVPTRDRAAYLKTLLKGLKESTDYPRFNVAIVDNGSVERDAIAVLDELAADPHFSVLRFPGPFNYSAMCNQGASSSQADVLVMLNNDIAMLESGWLRSLVSLAIRDDIGAVGAKLLYPNGTLQHAGIVIGSGGRAGHLYTGAPRDEPGYLNQLKVAHEVAAVTGACMAVERSKFDAIGGFDAINLPVDLNDVDLCLRLSERGWRAMWTPDAVLYHVESGTRRHSLRPATAYSQERRYFIQRWAHVIRDDPYFHPALSLFSHWPALASTD